MSIYDRLMSDLGRMDEREELPSRGGLLNNLRSQIIAPSNQMATQPTVIDDPRDREQIDPVLPNIANFINMGQNTVDLGGGLGSIALPQLSQEQINQILAGLNPTIFGINLPQATQEVTESNLEETGASDEVLEDTGDDTYDLGILDPTTGQVYEDEEDLPEGVVVGGGDGPAGTLIEGPYTPPPPPSSTSQATQVIAPSTTPTPTPVTDIVTGQEIPLNTPVVNVPQESLTGLGSYFTAPQIDQIVNPGYTPQATTDMDNLLQLQRDSFRNFLVQPATETDSESETVEQPISEPSGENGTGYMGDSYVPGNITFGQTFDPFNIGGTSLPSLPAGGIYNIPGGIQFTNQMYSSPLIPNSYNQLVAGGPMDNLYGNLVFPDFSGVTSLVPFEERRQVLDTQRRFPPVLF